MLPVTSTTEGATKGTRDDEEMKDNEVRVASSSVTTDIEKELVTEVPDRTNTDVAEGRVPLGFNSQYKLAWDVSPDSTEATFLKHIIVSCDRPVQVGEQVELHLKNVCRNNKIIEVYFTNEHPATVADNQFEFFRRTAAEVLIFLNFLKRDVRFKCHINNMGHIITKIDDEDEQKSATIDISSPVWMIISSVFQTNDFVTVKLVNSTASRQLTPGDKESKAQAGSSNNDVAETLWTPLRFNTEHKYGCEVSTDGNEATFLHNFVFSDRPMEVGEKDTQRGGDSTINTAILLTATSTSAATSATMLAVMSATTSALAATVTSTTSATMLSVTTTTASAIKARQRGGDSTINTAIPLTATSTSAATSASTLAGTSATSSELTSTVTSTTSATMLPVTSTTQGATKVTREDEEMKDNEVRVASSSVTTDTEKELVTEVPDPTNTDVAEGRVPLGFNSQYKLAWDVSPDSTEATFLKHNYFVSCDRPVQVGEQVELHLKDVCRNYKMFDVYFTNKHPATVADNQFEFFRRTVAKVFIFLNFFKRDVRLKCHINNMGHIITKIDDEDEQKSATIDISSPVWIIISLVFLTNDFSTIKLVNSTASRQLTPGDKESKAQAGSSNNDVAETLWTPLRFNTEHKYGCEVSTDGNEATFLHNFVFSDRPMEVGEKVELHFKCLSEYKHYIRVYLTNEHPATVAANQLGFFDRAMAIKNISFMKNARFKCHINNMAHVVTRIDNENEQKLATAITVDISSPVWMIICSNHHEICAFGTMTAKFVNSTASRQDTQRGGDSTINTAIPLIATSTSAATSMLAVKSATTSALAATVTSTTSATMLSVTTTTASAIKSASGDESKGEVRDTSSTVTRHMDRQIMAEVPDHTNTKVAEDRVPLGFNSEHKCYWDVSPVGTEATMLKYKPFVSSDRPVKVGEQVELHWKIVGKGTRCINVHFTNEHPETVTDDQYEFFRRTVAIETIFFDSFKRDLRLKCHINNMGHIITKIDDKDEKKSAIIDINFPVWMIIYTHFWLNNFVTVKLVNSTALRQITPGDNVAEALWMPLRFNSEHKYGCEVSPDRNEVTFLCNFVSSDRPIEVGEKCKRGDEEMSTSSFTTVTEKGVVPKGNSLESARIVEDEAVPAGNTTDACTEPADDIDDNGTCGYMTINAHFSTIVKNLLPQVPNADRIKCMTEILETIEKFKGTPK